MYGNLCVNDKWNVCDTSKNRSIIVLSPIKRALKCEIVCFFSLLRHKSYRNNNKIIFVCKLWRLRMIPQKDLNVFRIITTFLMFRLPLRVCRATRRKHQFRLLFFCCFLLTVMWRRIDELNLFLEWFHTLKCEMKLNDREWKMIACVRVET